MTDEQTTEIKQFLETYIRLIETLEKNDFEYINIFHSTLEEAKRLNDCLT